MEIDLTQLEPDGVRVHETFVGEQLAGGADSEDRIAPLQAELDAWVRPAKGLARATGSIRARVRAECDRCLKPIDVDIEGEFDQRYAWEGAPDAPPDESEVDPSELDIERLEGQVLDTAALAREQVELNAPMGLVCEEACRGLCPVCRADRNTVACGCETTETDPRWDALKNLKLN